MNISTMQDAVIYLKDKFSKQTTKQRINFPDIHPH